MILLLGETIGLWFLYEKMNIPPDRFDAAFWAYQFAIFSTMPTTGQASASMNICMIKLFSLVLHKGSGSADDPGKSKF